MFDTRKKLKQKISELEYQLARFKERDTILNSADLPPCKDMACLGCEHIVIYKGASYSPFVVGCGKGTICPDFKRKRILLTEEEKQRLLLEIQERVLS